MRILFAVVVTCVFVNVVCAWRGSALPRAVLLSGLRMHTETTLSPRDERRRILGSPNYNRMGFKEEKLSVEETMSSEFTSPLVAELRANKGTITRGDVTVKLAEFYGFCWGVERAVSVLRCVCGTIFSLQRSNFPPLSPFTSCTSLSPPLPPHQL